MLDFNLKDTIMSLCVLSNSQQEYESADAVLGVQNPNSFHNALSNTITLPPNSEVGVVSTKMFRKSSVVIQGNSVFYVYFGQMLTSAELMSTRSVNAPIPVIVRSGTYNHTQLTQEIQFQLTEAFSCHPNLAWFGAVVSAPIVGGSPAPTSGGWGYTLRQTSLATVDSAGAFVVNDISGQALTFQSLGESIQTGVDSLTYDGATKRLGRLTINTPAWDDAGIGMIKDLPITMTGHLALSRSTFAVDIREAITAPKIAGEGWRIGLSRPETRVAQGPGQGSRPEWYSDAPEVSFYDYVVEYDGDTELVTVSQSRINDVSGDMEMRPVVYFGADIQALDGNAFLAQANRTDLTYGGGTGAYLNWRIKGEQVKIWFTDDAYANAQILMDTGVDGWAQLGLNRAVKPVGTACQTLYPKFDLSTPDTGGVAGRHMLLVNYEVPLPWSQRHGQTNGYNFPPEVPLNGPYHTPNFEASSLWGKAIFAPLYEDQAWVADNADRNRGTGAQIAYTGMDGSLVINGAQVASEAIKYGYGFIFNRALADELGGYTNIGGTNNCRRWLGFPVDDVPGNALSFDGVAPLGSITDAGGGDVNKDSRCLWTVNSYDNLEDAPKQLFIKCSSLTHQSFNFCKGLPSKILWSVPRFSNSGTTTGPLYFQQSNPIYLSLRNNAPLVINDLQIDFVDKNEQIVEDLGGETIVVLHFKEGHKGCG